MTRASKTQQKRTSKPSQSFLQSAPASVMKPRLMVVLSAAALLVLGLVMVYSASSITGYVEEGSSIGETIKQIGFALGGIVLCVATIVVCKDDALRGKLGFWLWAGCVFLIVLTALMGTVGLGAKRWLFIGPVGIQPSEFAKIAIAIMAARIVCEYNEGAFLRQEFFKKLAVYVIIPILFILFAQSDLGTSMICLVVFIAALWLGGASERTVGAIVACVVVLGVVMTLVQGYRSDRMSFLDPWADPDGTGYQLIHSFKAFAAGGLFGLGIGNSYEKLLYLPEAETDFIFSIIGEELGLIGAVLVVVLFLVFLRGGLSIARQSSNDFGLILAGSLTTMLVFQAFLNILCVVGLFPTTGKPLPFISSGGSSLLSSLIIVGIILSVSFNSHSKKEIKERRGNLRVISSYQQPPRRVGGGYSQGKTRHYYPANTQVHGVPYGTSAFKSNNNKNPYKNKNFSRRI